jgi:hypothetical protein
VEPQMNADSRRFQSAGSAFISGFKDVGKGQGGLVPV